MFCLPCERKEKGKAKRNFCKKGDIKHKTFSPASEGREKGGGM